MIINIFIPPNQAGLLDDVAMFNLIKRNQEDLLHHIPTLRECNIQFSELEQNPVSSGQSIIAKHILTTDETSLKIIVRYRHNASVERISSRILMELNQIKQIY